MGTGACRPRDQESIPHTVSKWASPQPNPLVAFEKTMARLTVNLVLSIAYLGRFLFFILAAAVVRFSKRASRICWRYLVADLPCQHPVLGFITPPSPGLGSHRIYYLLFFFLSQTSIYTTNRRGRTFKNGMLLLCKHASEKCGTLISNVCPCAFIWVPSLVLRHLSSGPYQS